MVRVPNGHSRGTQSHMKSASDILKHKSVLFVQMLYKSKLFLTMETKTKGKLRVLFERSASIVSYFVPQVLHFQ